MAQKSVHRSAYKSLLADISSGELKNIYVFTGEEKYLLEYCVRAVRSALLASGTDDFNYRRLDGRSIDLGDLADAADAVPLFAERTLVEVWDYDIDSRGEEHRKRFAQWVDNLPDYVCVLLVYTDEFKLDGRIKLNQELKKKLNVVTFELQDQSELVKWLRKRFRALGKEISAADAEYLSFLMGGSMTSLVTETEKVSAYAKAPQITRADIDAVVVTTPETEAYKLSDAIVRGQRGEAAARMSELFQMHVAPQKLMFWIGRDIRWLFCARLCIEKGKGTDAFVELCSIRFRFQAENILRAARGRTTDWCHRALDICCDTAYRMNSSGADGEDLLRDLLIRLSV